MAINLNNPYGMVGIQPNIGTITPPPTPAPTIPGFTGFGDRLATIGGFGDDPDELKTQEELAKMTQAQIDQYTKQRKGARRSGVSEALIQFGEALQGKPATENALKRKQALQNMEMQKQYQAEYQAAIQAAEQTNPAQARLLRSLGLPGFVNLQQKRAEQMFLGGGKKQTYKPELVEYKNTSSENIKIGNYVIKPGEQIPFNVSIPEIANSISGKPGLVEVKEKTIYSRPGSLYTTDKGDYREMIIGDRQQFSGPEGTFTSEEFFAKYPLTRTKTASEEARYIPDVKAFNKINTDLVSVEKSMFQTENYWKNVKNSNIGMEKLGDQISQWFTTLAGQQNLTEDQLYRAISQGQLQGLIGANRIDTVGGGVMTEKDAWRILTRLGGEVNALQNPSVVGPLLQEMYELKVFDYNEQIKSYNNAVDSGKFKGYEKRNPITSEEVTSRFTLLPNGIPAGSKKINVQGTTLYQKGNKYYAVLPNGTVDEVDID